MGQSDTQAARIAAILNASWHVRAACRPHQAATRQRAVLELADLVRLALDQAEDPAPILDAVAQGWRG